MPTVRWRLFFEFLAETGLRIGEAIEVRWSDIDLGQRWLSVDRRLYRGRVAKPKGRKTRRVRISEPMARSLWTPRKDAAAAADGDLVFPSPTGHAIDQSNVMSRVLKPAARTAGVGDWVGFHAFRHTCATRLFRSGWNAAQVQRFLGHSDPGFTLRRYIHLLDEDMPEPIAVGRSASPTALALGAGAIPETAGVDGRREDGENRVDDDGRPHRNHDDLPLRGADIAPAADAATKEHLTQESTQLDPLTRFHAESVGGGNAVATRAAETGRDDAAAPGPDLAQPRAVTG